MIEPLIHSQEEEAMVEAQLGRPLRGAWRVARRCHLGIPMVIENSPRLPDGSPFPTLFWLTCPVLVKGASRLESGGWMEDLTAALGAGGGLRDRFALAAARYRERRGQRGVIPDPGTLPGGGPDRVKCLHAHLAHQLGDPPNPIGAATLTRTGWPDCREPCVRPAGADADA